MKEQIDLLNRGESKYQAKDFLGAIKDFRKVIELYPDEYYSYFAYFGRGQAKCGIKDYAGAINDYSEAIRLIGNDFGFSIRGIKDSSNDIVINKNQVHLFRAIAKYVIKDYVGAIQDFSKAIELGINDYQAYAGRGESRLITKDYSGAIRDFSKIMEFFPNSPQAYINRGKAKFEMGDYSGAINDYSRAIEFYPQNLYYYDYCIEAYERLNDSKGVQMMKEKKAIAERG